MASRIAAEGSSKPVGKRCLQRRCVALTGALAVVAAIVLAVVLSSSSGSGRPDAGSLAPTSAPTATIVLDVPLPEPGSAERVALAAGELLAVPKSRVGRLTVMVDANGAPQARSYEGGPWEVIQGAAATCDTATCVLEVSDAAHESGEVRITTYAAASPPGDDALAARFLMQATFGPTRDTVSGLQGKDWKEWIETQAALPPTLLRSYFRRRANVPLRAQALAGRPRDACEAGSRWHRFAFSVDDVGRTVVVVDHGSYLELGIDGVARHHWTNRSSWPVPDELQPLVVCSVEPRVGGEVTLGAGCAAAISNPAIHFTSAMDASRTLIADEGAMQELTPPVPDAMLLTAPPSGCNTPAMGPAFVRTSDGKVLLHDPRLVMLDNSLEAPAVGSQSRASCPNVPRTFLNVGSCVVSTGACSAVRYSDAQLTLDEAAVRTFFTVGGKYVYYITGLSTDAADSPCKKPSRWVFASGNCASTSDLDVDTLASLRSRLVQSFTRDGNPLVRDIEAPDGTCEAAKGVALDVEADGQAYCFEQVHPQLFNVYDFSGWTMPFAHPGNKDAFEDGRANPIASPAEVDAESELRFPDWHPTKRWSDYANHFELLGRLHDRVSFRDLPTSVQSEALGQAFGAVQSSDSGDASEAVAISCGSPGELAPEPRLGSRYGIAINSPSDAEPGRGRLDEVVPRYERHNTLWTSAVVSAPDQLRHRVAWALSQVFVASVDGTEGTDTVEPYLAFYDIFVRHALGSFRDVLREVSYSPLMARMLSFLNSKSMPYSLERGTMAFPDENYAREVMQLFTIGLVELHEDGTEVLDAAGRAVPTYSNDDILEFARVWTGFERQPLRGNIETRLGDRSTNVVDPMRLRGDWRDPFPKLGLRKHYVGDGYAVCEELPERGFLRKGAVYRFLGSSPSAELQKDPSADFEGELAMRVELDGASSALFARLCDAADAADAAAAAAGDLSRCRFKAELELDAHLACAGVECELDTVRTVMLPVTQRRCPQGTVLVTYEGDDEQGDVCRDVRKEWSCPAGCSLAVNSTAPFCVLSGSQLPCRVDPSEHRGLFFEFVRQPCVHLPFFNGGRRIGSTSQRSSTCADPRSVIAAEACCTAGSSRGINDCRYAGERLSYASAALRCEEAGMTTCDYKWVGDRCPQAPWRLWTSAACSVKAKVSASGSVAIVHEVGQSPRDESTEEQMRRSLKRESQNWFRALWSEKDAFPHAGRNACGGGECEELVLPGESEASCLCNVTVVESAVFDALPSSQEAIEQLKVGSAPVDRFDHDEFVLAASASGVKAYARRGGTVFDASTVLEVATTTGETKWLRNVRSEVHVGAGFVFRNPPSFHDPDLPESRDAMHETEAVLDHYLSHPSNAPFVARSLIQHLVTSNPSPRYVSAVAGAFRSGEYAGLGSGKYGDLLAATAAVLLDAEAREAVLDLDPTFGQHRESMLKVMHLLRAMEVEPVAPMTELVLRRLDDYLGMEPLNAPSVFSFYLPAYSPAGPIKRAALVAPEAQLMTSPLIVSTLNALFSLVRNGLTQCEYGLGLSPDTGYSCTGITGSGADPEQRKSRARVAFEPAGQSAEEVVAEVDLLLTAGRLDDRARGIMEQEHADELADSGSSTRALRAVLQLMLGTPHFHSSNQCTALPEAAAAAAEEKEQQQEKPSDGEQQGARANEPFKAVVYVFLSGGMDSFNALVPHSGCGDKDMYAEYVSVRGKDVLALPKDQLLQIQVGDEQPCSTFGLHPALQTVHRLYEEGDAIMLANTGNLVEPVSKNEPGERPNGLYAHNIQSLHVQTAMPQSARSSGVMGRMQDVLLQDGFEAASYSISGNSDLFVSDAGVSPPADILSKNGGVQRLDKRPYSARIRPALEALNGAGSSSLFGDAWAATFRRMLNRTEELSEVMEAVELEQTFEAENFLADQMEQVAKLIKAREMLGNNRQAFFVQRGGFDSHDNGYETMQTLLSDVDAGVDSLVQELKLQGVWDDVVVVFTSEFARTLSNNGAGTDHAWGGNYWMIGGGLRGGRVLGEYPDDLTEAGELNLGRGRLIPTTSWDAVWNGVAQWLGVDEESLDDVLPNRGNFGEDLFSAADLFNPEQ